MIYTSSGNPAETLLEEKMKLIRIILMILVLSFGSSAFAGQTVQKACPGKGVAGKVTRTKIGHANLVIVHMPITKSASNNFADLTMGNILETGDTSPNPTILSKKEATRIARDVAKDLKIKVCRTL